MRRITTLAAITLAALTLTACGAIKDLLKTPPVDLTGAYADLSVDYGEVCGAARQGEFHLAIDTEITDDGSLHSIDATAVIYDAGRDGRTITKTATWTARGKSLSSGAIEDFGTVTLTPAGDGYEGVVTLFNVECTGPDPDDPSKTITTYERAQARFQAARQ